MRTPRGTAIPGQKPSQKWHSLDYQYSTIACLVPCSPAVCLYRSKPSALSAITRESQRSILVYKGRIDIFKLYLPDDTWCMYYYNIYCTYIQIMRQAYHISQIQSLDNFKHRNGKNPETNEVQTKVIIWICYVSTIQLVRASSRLYPFNPIFFLLETQMHFYAHFYTHIFLNFLSPPTSRASEEVHYMP